MANISPLIPLPGTETILPNAPLPPPSVPVAPQPPVVQVIPGAAKNSRDAEVGRLSMAVARMEAHLRRKERQEANIYEILEHHDNCTYVFYKNREPIPLMSCVIE